MSTPEPITDSVRGYLSLNSKRRFTLVAGILGAVFFLAQVVLPFLVMFLVMFPVMFRSIAVTDMDHAEVWRNQLWFVERTTQLNWRAPESSTMQMALRRVNLTDLSPAGPSVPLDRGSNESEPALLPIGDRLWLIGADKVSHYDGTTLTQLSGGGRPARASSPFAYQGHPAVVSWKTQTLAALQAEGGRAEWTAQAYPLSLPEEDGSIRSLQAVEAGGRLHLFAELCAEEPEKCWLSYRDPEPETWQRVFEDDCACASWTAVALGSRPAVVVSEREKGREKGLAVVTLTENGPQRERIEPTQGHSTWDRWHALTLEGRLLLVSEGMPGALTLVEVAGGRVVRSVKTTGWSPFGPHMMLLMLIPQLLPILLSLILALVLTTQMRQHRVQSYLFEGSRRTFASLWQRALAQLVDVVPLGAGFLLPSVWMWRAFSDPERLADSGPMFMLWLFGLVAAAFASGLLVLVAYSYYEGRFGKTPGKWLLGIRVLGTDLRPCGFGRALLRNLLTFVDGFLNFLVGTLLVALTDNWQRLGDLAARTIVVVDEKPA